MLFTRRSTEWRFFFEDGTRGNPFTMNSRSFNATHLVSVTNVDRLVRHTRSRRGEGGGVMVVTKFLCNSVFMSLDIPEKSCQPARQRYVSMYVSR